MGKALSYTINQWHKLCQAVKCSSTLDNNGAENAVRPQSGGEELALHWLDPYAYLKWFFEKIPGMTHQDDMRALLRSNWVKQLEPRKPSEASVAKIGPPTAAQLPASRGAMLSA